MSEGEPNMKYEVGCKYELQPDPVDRTEGYFRDWAEHFLEADFRLLDCEAGEEKITDRENSKKEDKMFCCNGKKKLLVMNKKKHKHEFFNGCYVGAIDIRNTNRAFVGHLVSLPLGRVELLGAIVNFDKEGKVIFDLYDSAKYWAATPSFMFEHGHEMPQSNCDSPNVFLYGNTFLVAYGYDKMRTSFLTGAQFGGKQAFIFHINTKQSTPFRPQCKVIKERWLCMPTEHGELVVDLSSFRAEKPLSSSSYSFDNRAGIRKEDDKYVLLYDRMLLPREHTLEDVLAVTSNVPQYVIKPDEPYYPKLCIKCEGETVIGSCQGRGLGSGWCLICQIRWSESANKWVCTLPNKRYGNWGDCCDRLEPPHYVCSEAHPEHVVQIGREMREMPSGVWKEYATRPFVVVNYRPAEKKLE